MDTTLPESATDDDVLFSKVVPAVNVSPKLLDDQFAIVDPPPPEQIMYLPEGDIDTEVNHLSYAEPVTSVSVQVTPKLFEKFIHALGTPVDTQH